MRRTLAYAFTLTLAFQLLASIDLPEAAATDTIDGVWSALDAVPSPPARREYAAIHDRVHHRYVMFAGFTNQLDGGYHLFNEIWTLDLDGSPTWSQVVMSGDVPGPRHSPQWGYDPTRNRLIVFGGYGSHYPGSPWAFLDDVWELKLNGTPRWIELFPNGTAPTGRLAGVAAYDVLHQRFVGFGGTAGLPVDTWQLDLRGRPEWSTMPTSGEQPPGSYGMTSIFDAVRNRMVVFGGSTSSAYYGVQNDTWELNLRHSTPRWRRLHPGGTLPAARRGLTSIFDPRRDRMVIFGGWDGSTEPTAFLNDTWGLSLTGQDGNWNQLFPGGTVPCVRDIMSAAYDTRHDRMVLFGGWSGTEMLGDTQFLEWSNAGQSALVSASVENDNGAPRVEWSTQNTVGPIGAVYRREPSGEWTSLGVVEADAQGRMSFTDNSAVGGHDYGYQLIVSSELGDEFVGEVWTAAPTAVPDAAVSAALMVRAWPNPAVGQLAISLALPRDGPATLELFDVRGQRLLARDVRSFGPGEHRMQIGDAADYPAGVYFVRLTQSRQSVTSQLLIAR